MPTHQLKDMHLYLDIPTPIFKARLNLASAVYPLTALPFDGVTLGTYDLIQPDMTLILGTTDGADDLGRVRVQNLASTTSIPIGRVSQGIEDGTITAQNDAYITVWDDYRVWARIPVETADGDVFKDSDVPVGDFNTELPPVANCGPGFADYIDPITDLITVQFPDGGVNTSFAMADGATIVTHDWDVKDGTITVGTSASAVITATFPAGKRWVAYTVTDSNGKQHTSRCLVVAVDPDDDVTVPFTVATLAIEAKGQTLSVGILEDMPRSTYPDGCPVLFWWDTPSSPGDRDHMRFIGYHQSDSVSIRATPTGLIRETTLHCLDVAGRLDTLPGFPQALERNDEEEYWAYMPTLTLRKALHYLAHWHSTALSLADLDLPIELEDDYPSMRLDSTGSSLYDQINSRAQSAVPDYWLTCDIQGRLHVIADWMLLDVADRPASFVGTLTEEYWQDIKVDYRRPPLIYLLDSSAVVCSTDWLVLGGENTLPLAFCKAPGYAFGQGVSEMRTAEKLTPSQEVLNSCEGHRYARINARYGLFTIIEPSGDIDTFQPAHMNHVQLNISAASAAQRGLEFTQARGLVKRIDMRFNHTPAGTWIQPTLQWEREVIGAPAVTHIPEIPEEPDFETPEPPPGTVPPEFGLIGGQQLVAAIGSDGYRYKTTDFQTVSGSGGPTWTRDNLSIAATIYNWVVDPFSPGYAPGATSGAVNGWVVNDTDIYRVTDMHGTTIAISVFTFPTATIAASFHWRSIQASFGAYFAEGANPWLLCVSYYGDTSGHEGTWATRSTDGGVTWSAEVQISADFDADTPTRFNPIGVFTSPRTPGKAYTAAHVNASSGPLPLWGWWEGNVLTELGTSASASLEIAAAATDPGPIVTVTKSLLVAPPEDAVRIEVDVVWSAVHTRSGGAASGSSSMNLLEPINVTQTGTDDYDSPEPNTSTSGAFSITWTLASGTNWPISRESVEAGHPASASGTRCQVTCVADASGAGNTDETVVNITMTVTEIELDGAIVYQPTAAAGAGFVATDWGASWAETALIEPGQGQAGSIHVPWEDNTSEGLIYYGHLDKTTNHEFRLKQSAGGVITDISPTDTGIDFGVNHYGFSIRAYDSDRQFLALGGIGNDTSADPADDLVGLWVSSNAGTAWTNILAPVAASNALHGLQIAFGGDDSDVLFAWGGWSNAASLAAIYYSSDFGATLDSREGNINSLGTVALIGIAGGPTP